MKGLILLLLTMAFLSACSNPIESKKKCPCFVKIPQLQEDGSYKLQVVQFKTIEDIQKIKSSKIQISMNPRFFADGTVEDLQPEAQYVINRDNVIVPTRTETAEMFSIYKIMEDLYFFDKQIGLDRVLRYPMRVSLQTRTGRRNGLSNNASYMPLFDRISVLKYLGDKVPLSLNPGVLAHEHFHAIFNAIIKPIEATVKIDGYRPTHDNLMSDQEEHEYTFTTSTHHEVEPNVGFNFLILRALDEGTADFWANLQTGLTNSYLASFSEREMKKRDVVAMVYLMDRQEELRSIFDFHAYKSEESIISDSDRPIHGSIYGKAVMYSNLLKTLSESIGGKIVDENERKVVIGEWIISSLKKLSMVVETKGQSEALTQGEILNNFVPENLNKETVSEVCSNLNIFLMNNEKASACSGY